VIKIKISTRGAPKGALLSQFLGNNQNTWKNCQFFLNCQVDRPDFWFVIEDTDDDDRVCQVPRDRVFFLSAETAWPPGYYSETPGGIDFLKQFSHVFTCHDVYLPTVTYTIPFLPWMINSNHGNSMFSPHTRDLHFFNRFQNLSKLKLLSVFCSSQTWTPTHRMRLRFVEGLKEHFGDRLDWYGNGIQTLSEKWEGIAPYRYTIVLENQASKNVVTEKLQDAFLGLSYPIYWGAPNVEQYFSKESFSPIDIKDLKGSIESIEEIVSSDLYVERLGALRESRNRVLFELNFLARIGRIAEEIWNQEGKIAGQHVEIRPMKDLVVARPPALSNFIQRSGRYLERRGSKLKF